MIERLLAWLPVNEIEVHSIMVRVARNAVLSRSSFGEQAGVVSAVLVNPLAYLGVTIQAFVLGASKRNCVALRAVRRAIEETVRLRQRSG